MDTDTVKRVIDGDTVKLAGGERVRLIGIDSPEAGRNKKLFRDARRTKQDTKTILRMGLEASAFARRLVEGKRVFLEYDVENKAEGTNKVIIYIDDQISKKYVELFKLKF